MLNKPERKTPVLAEHSRTIMKCQNMFLLRVIDRRGMIPSPDRKDLACYTRQGSLERIKKALYRFMWGLACHRSGIY